jgi:hypothetical protein
MKESAHGADGDHVEGRCHRRDAPVLVLSVLPLLPVLLPQLLQQRLQGRMLPRLTDQRAEGLPVLVK